MAARFGFRILSVALPSENRRRFLESPLSRVKIFQFFFVIVMLVGAVLMFERPAYAYADPGTGLLAVQAAGSALIATGWYLRRKIASLFRSSDQPSHETVPQHVNLDREESPNP